MSSGFPQPNQSDFAQAATLDGYFRWYVNQFPFLTGPELGLEKARYEKETRSEHS
jgi:hypothetical protein